MHYFKDMAGFVADKKVFCGIDVHEKFWNLCFICDGEVVETTKIPSDPVKLLFLLKHHYSRAREVSCVYEAGFSGTGLYRKLRRHGYRCIITPPSLLPQSGSKVKTDKRDAQALASYLSADLLKAIYVLPEAVEADRRVIRRRSQLVKKVTRVKNQTKSFLHQHGLKKPETIKNNWSCGYVA